MAMNKTRMERWQNRFLTRKKDRHSKMAILVWRRLGNIARH
jgi:hypothetical protein